MIDLFPWQTTLARAWLSHPNRPAASLFYGLAGIGKSRLAQWLAQTLLCEASKLEPCNHCASCMLWEVGNHPDYLELSSATVPSATEEVDGEVSGLPVSVSGAGKSQSRIIQIDTVRAMARLTHLVAHRGGARVILIDPVEAMSLAAANALLKTLEEPPTQTYFLLVSGQLQLVLPTIRSRCQLFPMRKPDMTLALSWLKAQGIEEPEYLLAEAGGAPLRALEYAASKFSSERDQLLQVLLHPDQLQVLAWGERLEQVGKAERVNHLAHYLRCLVALTYDLILAKSVGRVQFFPGQQKETIRLVNRIRLVEVIRFYRELLPIQRWVNQPLNPRLLWQDVLFHYRALIRPGSQ